MIKKCLAKANQQQNGYNVINMDLYDRIDIWLCCKKAFSNFSVPIVQIFRDIPHKAFFYPA